MRSFPRPYQAYKLTENYIYLQKHSGGDAGLLRFFSKSRTMDVEALRTYIEGALEGTNLYLVDLTVRPGNIINVEVDSDLPVDIDECVALSRKIESEFDRDIEDYELEVGSAGITSPLKVPRQYSKYVGKEMEVLTRDGEKLKGILKSAGHDGFVLEVSRKVKREGEKKPVMETQQLEFPYEGVKYAKYLLKI